MKSKKTIIIVIVAVVIVLIAGIILWQGGFLKQGVEVAQQGIATISNKMTDNLYVEVTAQSTYAGLLNPTDMQGAISKKMDELLNKNNISTVEFGMYAQALYNDKTSSAEIDKRIAQRLAELQKAGAK